MKFLALCHYTQSAFDKLGPDDFEEIARLCAPHDAELKASGKVSAVGSLGRPSASRTLRVGGDGAITDTEGPWAETDTPFGAFFLVEADTIDEAVRIAQLHPGVHLGTRFSEGGIEVRPIEHLEDIEPASGT